MRAFVLALLVVAPLAAQTWTNADVRGYGFVTGLAVHPRTQVVYARTDVGGLFRWDGARWTGVLDGSLTRTTGWSASVEAFALDRRAPGRIWAALGNGGSGVIVRSDDDGQTWRETALPAGIAMAGNGAWRRAGERLAVDPNDSGVVYFGSREDGLWRTDDGGDSWARVASFPVVGDDGGPDDGPCAEPGADGCGPGGLPFVVFDSRSSATRDGRTVSANVYVGALGDGVYRSPDGGQTWARALPLPGTRDNPMRAEFAHGRLQVAVTSDGGGSGQGGLWLYVPDDRGTGGVALDKTPPTGCPVYGTYDWNAFAAHPTEAGYVAALPYGVTTRKLFFTRDILADAPVWEVSTDEGTYTQCPAQQLDHTIDTPPWADPEDGAYSYAGAGLFDLEQPDRFWFTTGWAVYRADDLRRDGLVIDYQDVMRGLEELCVPDVAAPGGAGPAFYTAVFDAFGFPHTSADQMPTTTVARGVQQNGTDVATTPADPRTAVIVGARNGGYRPAARITRDGGQTWADLPRLGDPTDPDDACTAFLTAGNLALSATDPDRMVWSPQSVIYPACTGYSQPVETPPHVTDDAGQTWRPVAGYDVAGGNWAAGTDFVVSQHLVADAVDGDRFYSYVKRLTAPFGTELWTSADGGETWANACSNCLPDYRFPRLQAHPQTAGEVWAVFRKETGADAQADLFRTTDYGASWTEVTTADSVWAFGFGAPLSGAARSTVYAHALVDGVEGIYYSTDDAASWTAFGGTDDVPIGLFDGMIGDPDEPGVVVAGSTCRGTWVGTLAPDALRAVLRDEGPRLAALTLGAPAPNPTGDRASVEVRTGAGGRLRVEVVDVLGRTLAVLLDRTASAGDVRTVRLELGDLPPGTYVVRATLGGETVTRPLTVAR